MLVILGILYSLFILETYFFGVFLKFSIRILIFVIFYSSFRFSLFGYLIGIMAFLYVYDIGRNLIIGSLLIWVKVVILGF